ncbi:universal stress protein [Actinomycetospora cinnamomea]|uniref:Nucleotide-binding universal stress UspA family protein n=1 Tax=Actinomycetospora cinnamomea TaxID=663609 RepID=A0A2U1F284_9PSEU|nr:universal stress protein [Actinomycetospora cinnamomea]PVZ06293.1 nucleotide-binding universal stress UspA family protein [Actinomycetospora cinnamomea]
MTTAAATERPDEPPSTSGRVVVGVDGSSGSREALRAAILAADLRGDTVQVITAPLSDTELGAWGSAAWPAMPLPDPDRIVDAARDTARSMVADVLGELDGRLRTTPRVDVQAVPGNPARVLIEAARGADRLVVGHRGRGAVSSLVLGSVGLHCLADPPCPVTIVPPADDGS